MEENNKQNLLITGISGSVGHYLFDLLAGDPKYQLYLLVRSPEKIKRDLSKYSNITILQEDLHNISNIKKTIAQMDYVIHIATTWGGYKRPWNVNVVATFRLLRYLDPNRIKKIIYFSTASILDRDHQPVPKIRTIGTNYIRSKFLAHKMMQKHPLKDKIITVFPTWVYGGRKGDKPCPFSHAAEGILGIKNSIKIAKYLKFDFKFHFIHCADIAQMTKYLLENNVDKNEYVLGSAPVTIGQFLKETAQYFGQKVPFQINIPVWLILSVAKLKKAHSWDYYCIKYRHFVYDNLSCKKLGLPSTVDTVPGLLDSFFKT